MRPCWPARSGERLFVVSHKRREHVCGCFDMWVYVWLLFFFFFVRKNVFMYFMRISGHYKNTQRVFKELHVSLTELSPWPLVGLWGVFGTLWAPLPPSQLDTHPLTPCRLSSSNICRRDVRKCRHSYSDTDTSGFLEERRPLNHHSGVFEDTELLIF